MNKKISVIALFVGQVALADPLPIPVGNLFGQASSTPVPANKSASPVAPASQLAVPGAPVPAQSTLPLQQPNPFPVTPTVPVTPVVSKPLQIQKFVPPKLPPKRVHHKHVDQEDDTVAPFYEISNDHQAVPPKDLPKPAPKPVHPLEVPLPGLGTVQGDRLLNKSALIRVYGDGTEIVDVSNQFQNRISTPFDSPKIVDSSNSEIKIVGSSIYISLTGKPVVVYITGSVNGDPVISLTLVPKPIPAQTVVLQLDQPLNHPADKHKDKPESYEQHLSSLLKTVAMGENPEGFTKGHIDNIVARKGVLAIFPTARFSNAYMDIFSYKITNTGTKETRLAESSFYQKGVLAVGMFPASTLKHNESTFVYVISNKTALGENRGQ